MTKRLSLIFLVLVLLLLTAAAIVAQNKQSSQYAQIVPAADHHQHLFSPAYAKRSPGVNPVAAQDLVELLDKADIRRAVLLSTAFSYGSPGKEPENEYEAVKSENDWTAAQAALFPKRMIAFCSFNPLKEYALDELTRCAQNPNLRRGIKLHFGNSDVQLDITEHFEKLKIVFEQANRQRMAIVVHLRASLSKQRPYGTEQARLFLKLLAFAPDIPVQIAHLAGAGPGFVDAPARAAIEVLAEAVAKKDRRTRNLWFDVASNAHPDNPAEASEEMVRLIRRIGVKRILYGSDGAAGKNLRPRDSWAAFANIGLTKKEIKTIAGNIAPYMH